MKKYLVGLVMVLCTMVLSGCDLVMDRVQPGYVGVVVNKLGDSKGVDTEVMGVGRQWLGWNRELYVFPTFKQLKMYDDKFSFQMSDGTPINYGIGVEYSVDPTKVVTVFQTWRKGVDDITNIDVRQAISVSLVNRASVMSTDSFIGGGKEALLKSVLADLQAKFAPQGIKIHSVSWIGKPDYPDSLIDSINAKLTASQKTLQRQQEVQQSKAEADKAIEEARGVSESNVLKAKAEAEAITVKAQAESEAIKLRAAALRANPEVMQLEAINKWDGTLPQYMTSGSAVPFVPVPSAK
uniref:Lipoprotein n=1 Tax=Serratia phage Spe5P4 TaxID=3159438 RepID=A0AAU7VGW5_9CAUD